MSQNSRNSRHKVGNLLQTLMVDLDTLRQETTDNKKFRALFQMLDWTLNEMLSISEGVAEKTLPLQAKYTHNLQVLLADDEDLVRDSLREFLQGMNCDVVCAKNGAEALDICEAKLEAFDLVILDTVMPEMNGAEAFYAIRAVMPSTRFLFVSGYSREILDGTHREPEVIGFLRKPFRMSELKKILESRFQLLQAPAEIFPQNEPQGGVPVLVVEDDNDIANMLREYLSGLGYAVTVESNGNRAAEKITKQEFDILVLDWNLPGSGGLELTSLAKEKYSDRACYVLLITGKPGIENLQQALTVGVDDYLSKPFSLNALGIRMAVAQKSLENERRRAVAEKSLRDLNLGLERRVKERTFELRENENLYRSLVELSPQPIIVHDLEKIYLASNSMLVMLSVASYDDLKKHHIAESMSHGQWRIFKSIYNSVLSQGKGVREYSLSLEAKDRKIEVNCSSNQIQYMGRQMLLTILRDISSEKERQQQLLQMEKLSSLGTLVSGIAHEINNPVHFIRLNLPFLRTTFQEMIEIIRNQFEEGERVSLGGVPFIMARETIPQLINDVEMGTDRIKHLVDELKDYSRPQPKEVFEIFNLTDVVNSSRVLLRAFIRKHTRFFKVVVEPNLPTVHVVPIKIEQLIINLLQNACQSLEDDSKKIELRLYLDKESEQVVLEVVDEGVGIPPENLKRICDPFFTTHGSEGGTGLGLSICERIVNNHCGEMKFIARPNGGTKVQVKFPKNEEDV